MYASEIRNLPLFTIMVVASPIQCHIFSLNVKHHHSSCHCKLRLIFLSSVFTRFVDFRSFLWVKLKPIGDQVIAANIIYKRTKAPNDSFDIKQITGSFETRNVSKMEQLSVDYRNEIQLNLGEPINGWCVLFIGFLGTDAWIDAAGYLWQKDYIADKEGFRILKNKKIFVGQSRPIKVEFFRLMFLFCVVLWILKCKCVYSPISTGSCLKWTYKYKAIGVNNTCDTNSSDTNVIEPTDCKRNW